MSPLLWKLRCTETMGSLSSVLSILERGWWVSPGWEARKRQALLRAGVRETHDVALASKHGQRPFPLWDERALRKVVGVRNGRESSRERGSAGAVDVAGVYSPLRRGCGPFTETGPSVSQHPLGRVLPGPLQCGAATRRSGSGWKVHTSDAYLFWAWHDNAHTSPH